MKSIKKYKKRFRGHARTQSITGAVVVLVVVIAGVQLLVSSHAQSPYVSSQATSGTLTAPATVVPTCSGSSSGTCVQFGSPDNTNYITTSGTNFMLAGKVFQFIGYDAYGMEGCFNGAWTTAQLDAYFSSLPANGVTRIWAFQYYGTKVLSTILTEAARYNQHLILVLGNDDSACNETDGSINGKNSGKTLAFYQTGWQGNYLTWVNTVVPMFKNNPSVMMWEVANEPGNDETTPISEAVMQAYIKGASNAIRADDPNHLISTGASYDGALGGNLSGYEQINNLPNIDAISFHDYSYVYENGIEVSSTYTNAKAASQADNKPFYAGETGVESGSTCSDNQSLGTLTLADRVTFLETKTNDYFNGSDMGGIMFWEYEPAPASWLTTPCNFEIYPGDPLIPLVTKYLVP